MAVQTNTSFSNKFLLKSCWCYIDFQLNVNILSSYYQVTYIIIFILLFIKVKGKKMIKDENSWVYLLVKHFSLVLVILNVFVFIELFFLKSYHSLESFEVFQNLNNKNVLNKK